MHYLLFVLVLCISSTFAALSIENVTTLEDGKSCDFIGFPTPELLLNVYETGDNGEVYSYLFQGNRQTKYIPVPQDVCTPFSSDSFAAYHIHETLLYYTCYPPKNNISIIEYDLLSRTYRVFNHTSYSGLYFTDFDITPNGKTIFAIGANSRAFWVIDVQTMSLTAVVECSCNGTEPGLFFTYLDATDDYVYVLTIWGDFYKYSTSSLALVAETHNLSDYNTFAVDTATEMVYFYLFRKILFLDENLQTIGSIPVSNFGTVKRGFLTPTHIFWLGPWTALTFDRTTYNTTIFKFPAGPGGAGQTPQYVAPSPTDPSTIYVCVSGLFNSASVYTLTVE